jgi:hypothetical protein|tara:strand:+ start:36 stop:269 length:234 start_codon:yes stop_codon:yes gene_type:complete
MTVHRITDLSERQQQAVVKLVNRLASLGLPDDFVESLLTRTANDAEAIWRYMMDEGFARYADNWLKENVPAIVQDTT